MINIFVVLSGFLKCSVVIIKVFYYTSYRLVTIILQNRANFQRFHELIKNVSMCDEFIQWIVLLLTVVRLDWKGET